MIDRNYAVYISDAKSPSYEKNRDFFGERDEWARENCRSYVGMDTQDVSDVSIYYDEVATYIFTTEADRLVFALRWK